jgi:hypothetical protein
MFLGIFLGIFKIGFREMIWGFFPEIIRGFFREAKRRKIQKELTVLMFQS